MALSNICPTAICPELINLLGANIPDLVGAGSAAAAFALVSPGGQIDEIGVFITRAYGSTVTMRVGVEQVSESDQGTPDGYFDGVGSTETKSASVAIDGIVNQFVWAPLLDPYRNTTEEMQLVALTVREGATTYTSGNHLRIRLGEQASQDQLFPYVSTSDAGAAWVPAAGTPAIAARGAGRLLDRSTAVLNSSSVNWGNTTVAEIYRGNVWTTSHACRMSGVSLAIQFEDEADFAVRVYVNGELKANVELPEASASCVSGDEQERAGTITIPIAPIVLEAGDVVRTILEPQTANEITLPVLEFSDSAQRLEFTRGVDIRYTAGFSTPTWTDSDTQLAAITPVIDQIGGGSASSGSAGSVSTKLSVRSGKESFIAQVFIPDAASFSGEGLTGLTFDSSGLRAYYMRSDLEEPVGFNTGGTEGTFVEMNLGDWVDSGFVEIDAETMPGWYQLGIPNAAFAPGAESVSIVLRGVTNMAQVNIEIAIDQEVMLAPRGFDNLGVPTFVDSEEESVNEPVNTTLGTLTWPERIWYSSQWIVGGREDNRDLKKLTLLANDGTTTKASADYTDAANIVNVPPMTLN
ncbi:MAG: hypothetical protein KF691_03100 [Phycisphaeraceae bacterium]|nr:hypothetical protein [Phycisphaeraceae bacterium]